MKRTISITKSDCGHLIFPNSFDGSVNQWAGGVHDVVESDGRIRHTLGTESREAFLAFFLSTLG